MPDIPLPPALKWLAGVAGFLVIIAGAWVQFGGGVPLTKHSPVIQQSVEFDKVHDLEIYRINEDIRNGRIARYENSIESDGFLLGQYDKPGLTEGERFQQARLVRRIEKHKRELDRLDKK